MTSGPPQSIAQEDTQLEGPKNTDSKAPGDLE